MLYYAYGGAVDRRVQPVDMERGALDRSVQLALFVHNMYVKIAIVIRNIASSELDKISPGHNLLLQIYHFASLRIKFATATAWVFSTGYIW